MANNDRLPYGRNNGKPKGGGPISILSEYFCEYGSNINGLAEQKNAMLTNGPWCGRVRTPIVTATGKIIPEGELVICILPNSYKDKSKYSQRLQHRGPYSNSYTYIPVKPNKNAEFYVNGIYNAFRPQNQIVAWESMDILPILVGDRFCSDDNDFIITNISEYGIATLKCKQVSNGEYQIPLFLLFSKLYFGLKCWYYPNPKPLQALMVMDFSFNEEYTTNIFEKSLETPTNVVTLQGKPTDDTPPLSNPFQKGDILLSSYYWDGTLFKVTSASNSNVVVTVINGNCHTTELIHREMFPSFSKATLQQLAITLEV